MRSSRRRREKPVHWQLEQHWGQGGRPLPRRWVLADGGRPPAPPGLGRFFQWVLPPRAVVGAKPLDFSSEITLICEDISRYCPELGHIDTSRMLCTFTPSRSRSKYGLQARVTPMRLRGGQTTERYRGWPYQLQKFHVHGREMLYLVTFCLPRFLDQTFEEKLVTIFHELYHISPRFDGDIRRHPGRYSVHTHSKASFDQHMTRLVKQYLDGHPDPRLLAWLRLSYAELWHRHGGIYGIVVPRPKLIPLLNDDPRQSPAATPRLVEGDSVEPQE